MTTDAAAQHQLLTFVPITSSFVKKLDRSAQNLQNRSNFT